MISVFIMILTFFDSFMERTLIINFFKIFRIITIHHFYFIFKLFRLYKSIWLLAFISFSLISFIFNFWWVIRFWVRLYSFICKLMGFQRFKRAISLRITPFFNILLFIYSKRISMKWRIFILLTIFFFIIGKKCYDLIVVIIYLFFFNISIFKFFFVILMKNIRKY